jgi:hypothetical protein
MMKILAIAAAFTLLSPTPPEGVGSRPLPQGMTREHQRALDRGLAWLARNQGQDGAWRTGGYYGNVPCAMTASVGMALLSSGSTPTRGKYAKNISRAVTYLMKNFQPSGLIAAVAEEGRPMYGHGFSTLFLAQVLGMEEDRQRHKRLRVILTKAVELISASQSVRGGWYYTPNSNNDEGSVTVTQMQALRACQDAGVSVPKKTIDKAIRYIVNSANPDGGIRYRAGQGGNSRPAITAAAVATLYHAGKYGHPMANNALKYARARVTPNLVRMGHYYYAHNYLAQALFQKGGEWWSEYYREMAGRLVQRQAKNGSWTDGRVGPVYTTAVAVVILGLPHGFVPAYRR